MAQRGGSCDPSRQWVDSVLERSDPGRGGRSVTSPSCIKTRLPGRAILI